MNAIRLLIAILSGLLLFTACSSEIGEFNAALDADRSAREKMRAAIKDLEEYSSLPETGDEQFLKERADLLEQARNAHKEAVDSWKKAGELYIALKAKPGAKPDYLNNYATMLYYQYRMGLDVELEPAEEALKKAITIEDRKIYKDNLDLILVVQGKKEDENISEKNRELEEVRAKNRELFKLLD